MSNRAKEAVKTLSEIAVLIKELDDLSPENGYSPIGHTLCDIVYAGYTITEIETIFNELPIETKELLQQSSIYSEMELEKSVLKNIFAKFSNKSEFQNSKNQLDDFRKIIEEYPFSWSFSRADGEFDLIEKNMEIEISADNNNFVYFGRSMLPLSALSMYFKTNSTTYIVDHFLDSRTYAAKFINLLEKLNIIPQGKIIVTDDFFKFAKNMSEQEKKSTISYILDKDYDQVNLIKKLSDFGFENILFTEVHGMAEIMYPKLNRQSIKKYYNLQSAILPKHFQAEENDLDKDKIFKHKKDDVYVSTLLYKKNNLQ